ncbi:MAG: superoxide dismutase family protein [Lachnospiraceae bacterium]|nr:superoxide dismutase family protein [Lachnospiraceae bacterium]
MNNKRTTLQNTFLNILNKCEPSAYAKISGNTGYPQLHGTAYFFCVPFGGVLIEIEVFGLPDNTINHTGFFATHIHETGNCTPPFDKTGSHYNPANMPHPEHAGDLPPLLGNDGYAYSCFYTDRFNISDIIDRSIIIHKNTDDFATQPSGNAGDKIGCGVILKNRLYYK